MTSLVAESEVMDVLRGHEMLRGHENAVELACACANHERDTGIAIAISGTYKTYAFHVSEYGVVQIFPGVSPENERWRRGLRRDAGNAR
jgi:hypothetical protein